MTEEVNPGCTRPTGGPVEQETSEPANDDIQVQTKESKAMIKVGKKAPDFTAAGYQNGGFINVSLSDFLGKWVLLCFYPGDFTFV